MASTRILPPENPPLMAQRPIPPAKSTRPFQTVKFSWSETIVKALIPTILVMALALFHIVASSDQFSCDFIPSITFVYFNNKV